VGGKLGMRHAAPRLRSSSVRQMSNVEAAYVGAMIDGEGYFGHYAPTGLRRACQHNVMVVNTDLEIISALVRATGLAGVGMKNDSALTRKRAWLWYSAAINSLVDLAKQIAPYSFKAQRFLEEAHVF